MAAARRKQVDVSIIIPAYNEERYIGACLASIKRQRFSGTYEIILGDGNSTDNTPKIARDYGAIVVRENYGTPSGGRHAGTQAAKGRIFAFVSADVELSTNYLAEVEKAYADKRVAWALTRIEPAEGNGLEKMGAWVLNIFTMVLNPLGMVYVNADCLSCRADEYRKAGGFNPKLVTSEDTDLGMRLMKRGRFAYVGKPSCFLSMRRVRKWGYVKFVIFHTMNFFRTHLFASAAERYDPVR